jgi:hypothetical protein
MPWTTRTTRPTPPGGPPRSSGSGRRSSARWTPPARCGRSGPRAGARYSRRQLAFAARIRELIDQRYSLAAARRIADLEDDLAAERALTARLHERPGKQPGPGT